MALKEVKSWKPTRKVLSTFFASFRSWAESLLLDDDDDADFTCGLFSPFLAVESADFVDFEVSESNVEPSVASEPFRHVCCWRWRKPLLLANVWKLREIGGPWIDVLVELWLVLLAFVVSELLFCNGDAGSRDSSLPEGVLLETE